MRAFLLACLLCLSISPVFAQANLPNNPNAATVQGPDPTGMQGYPLATVPATGALPWPVTINGGLTGGPFEIGTISTANSFDTTVASGSTLTGTFEACKDVAVISVSIVTNETFTGTWGTLIYDWSRDGVSTSYSDTTSFNGAATNNRNYDFPVRGGAQFVRIRFTANGNSLPNPLTVHLRTIYRNTQTVNFPHFLGANNIWTPLSADQSLVPLTLAARTTTQTQIGFFNTNFKGAEFFLRVTSVPAVPGTGGLDVGILAEDNSGATALLNLPLTSHITTTGVFLWVIYPGSASTGAAMNVKQILSEPLPAIWGFVVTAYDAQAYTYSLSIQLLQ